MSLIINLSPNNNAILSLSLSSQYLKLLKNHTPLNYNLLHQHLEPIYNRLTSIDLFRRCELKTTQNPNESFHHSVWSRCSKKNFHSLRRVQFALVSAAAEPCSNFCHEKYTRYPGRLSWTSTRPIESQEKAI
ncbi:hypothetical protein PoB_003054700 [Plakobranchus ocellatus]|uniref:Uncharacterized protein n=1 Tax=Plakobranchus ocellatus TaxID=259542 RepID=A0AAV4AA06_9GAST|nr:hypothetical protein PoB_003054700 [Plakobranchus ocellatus]